MAIKGPNNQMQSRLRLLTAFILIIGFGAVGIRLGYMQIFKHDFYEQKATDLQTRDVLIKPNRGTIYDRNMQELAESASVVRVTVNPKGVISESKKKKGITEEMQQEELAGILAETLELDYETVLGKVKRTDTAYQKIAEKISPDTMKVLTKALDEADCIGVYTEPDTKRYYKYGSYLSAVLGYVNGDNVGVTGIESKYEHELAGTAGRIVRAQNAKNQDMPYAHEQNIPATDGNSLVTTIDSDIQSYLEKHLETALADNPEARDGVSGVVMDVKTGAILAMASMPDYDPNNAYVISSEMYLSELKSKVNALLQEKGINTEISEKYLREGGMNNLPETIQKNDELISELTKLRTDQLNKMWRNAAITDTYEPGSTFKLMNVATAYELGLVHDEDHFSCGGSLHVADWKDPIKCWKTAGHGSQTLAETLMNSCNVAMMQMAFKTGTDRFYEYFKAFGMDQPTGIDLPAESGSIWFGEFGEVDLAVASFGQRFTVTPIQMLNMVCAIVDNGNLKTPYVVKDVLNADGTVKSSKETEIVRQVISADTSAFMREAMEKVVSEGTGKNAYVAGYRVGGKTATSELLKEAGDVEDRYTASFIGVAPMDDPQIAIIVTVNDLPESAVHGGGAVAAPVVGRLMEDVLPYIGVIPIYSDEEGDRREVTIPNMIGYTEEQVSHALGELGLAYRFEGTGQNVVTDQIPAGGIKVPSSGTVILYMGGTKDNEQVAVPDLSGLSPEECKDTLAEYGLFLKQKGVASSQVTGDTTANKQNPVAGTQVNVGTVITVEFSNSTNIGD